MEHKELYRGKKEGGGGGRRKKKGKKKMENRKERQHIETNEPTSICAAAGQKEMTLLVIVLQ